MGCTYVYIYKEMCVCARAHTHTRFSNPWPVGTSEKRLPQTPGCCLSDNLQSSTIGKPGLAAPIPCQAPSGYTEPKWVWPKKGAALPCFLLSVSKWFAFLSLQRPLGKQALGLQALTTGQPGWGFVWREQEGRKEKSE